MLIDLIDSSSGQMNLFFLNPNKDFRIEIAQTERLIKTNEVISLVEEKRSTLSTAEQRGDRLSPPDRIFSR